MRLLDLTGKDFGRLHVIDRAENRGRYVTWRCWCECGNVVVVQASNLRSGNTTSCGCYQRERWVKANYKHGHTHVGGYGKHTPTYRSWVSMKYRCLYPKSNRYEYYGGRGITICERWMQFQNFLEDMGERPEGKTLDRIDVNGNYEPGNCRWATPKEQVANRRMR